MGAFHPIIDLNRTPVAGDGSSGHSKAARACAADDLPDAADLFCEMPSQPMFDEVLPLVLCFGPLASVMSSRAFCQNAGRHPARR
jgi:hypothetical protein